MRSRVSASYGAFVVGGLVIGGLFGDVPFQSLEVMFGNWVTDLFLALCGALLGALAHEIVTMHRGRLDFGADGGHECRK